METKEKSYIAGLILLSLTIIGGFTYQIYDTGNELVCRTNKPIGWEISVDHGEFVEATCPYTTKPAENAYCKPEFRSTTSYKNYGCQEVVLYKEETNQKLYIPASPSVSCDTKGVCIDCNAENHYCGQVRT